MSIFQLRDKWGTTVGDQEEFDTSSIWVGNIDNSSPPADKIVIGSFQGRLRIYLPALRAYRVDDMLLEKNMQAPIYQVAAIGQDIFQLGILHSRRLLVFQVVTEKSGNSLKLSYEIALKRNSFNFCSGTFGSGSKDLICIQSVDGQLQFNDANSLLFTVSLPDFILPGCLCYNSYTDSLFIANGALELEVYKYSSLGAFANAAKAETKKLVPENCIMIGETVLEMHYLKSCSKFSKNGELIVLTLQHIIVFDDNCAILSQHKLDYTPTCMQIYNYFEKGSRSTGIGSTTTAVMGSISELFEKWLLVCSASKHILVYKGVCTEWASLWTHVPIFSATITVELTKGMVVVLSDEGHLSVTYLGTQPSSHLLAFSQQKQIAFEKIEGETSKLRELINKYEKDAPLASAAKENARGLLNIKLQFVECGESSEYVEDPGNLIARGINGGAIEAKARLILSVGQAQEKSVKNVSLSFDLPTGIKMDESTLTYPALKNDTPLIVPICFRALNNVFPLSRKLSINATYQVTGTAASRVCNEECELPIGLFAIPISAPKQIKEAQYKVTLILSGGKEQQAPSLNTLFKEAFEKNPQYSEILNANPNLAAFRYNNGFEFGILLAKTGGKYRVQCAKFEGIWFALSTLYQLISKCIIIT